MVGQADRTKLLMICQQLLYFVKLFLAYNIRTNMT